MEDPWLLLLLNALLDTTVKLVLPTLRLAMKEDRLPKLELPLEVNLLLLCVCKKSARSGLNYLQL